MQFPQRVIIIIPLVAIGMIEDKIDTNYSAEQILCAPV